MTIQIKNKQIEISTENYNKLSKEIKKQAIIVIK